MSGKKICCTACGGSGYYGSSNTCGVCGGSGKEEISELEQSRREGGQRDARIKELESSGNTGQNNTELHRLNCAQTAQLSDDEIRRRIESREREGKPTGKLRAAARQRGI